MLKYIDPPAAGGHPGPVRAVDHPVRVRPPAARRPVPRRSSASTPRRGCVRPAAREPRASTSRSGSSTSTTCGKLLSGDFGAARSSTTSRSSTSSASRFPATVELTVAAMLFAVGLGIPLGPARRPPRPGLGSTAAVTVISLLGISIPVFVLGLTLVIHLRRPARVAADAGPARPRAPSSSTGPASCSSTRCSPATSRCFVDGLRHLILPAIALGSIPLAIITRITRASVLDVTNEDYVRTARAKGLKEKRVDSRHVMRNAWLPVVTVIGLQVGGLLAGAVHHRDRVRVDRRRPLGRRRDRATATTSSSSRRS